MLENEIFIQRVFANGTNQSSTEDVPRNLKGKAVAKKAAVACIIRAFFLFPGRESCFEDPDYSWKSGDARIISKLEILFIKRTTRPGDTWSGDVAFPGGKVHIM